MFCDFCALCVSDFAEGAGFLLFEVVGFPALTCPVVPLLTAIFFVDAAPVFVFSAVGSAVTPVIASKVTAASRIKLVEKRILTILF